MKLPEERQGVKPLSWPKSEQKMKERTLKDLFHRVKQVLPEEQELLTFPPEKPVAEALAVMHKRNISQVPVVAGDEVLGVFSYRSLAQGLLVLPEGERTILSLQVDEFLENLRFARITDELTALLDEFDIKDAVLVGSETRLQGIVTAVDALRYFYEVASPYIMLREIELATRELIRVSVSEQELRDCIERSLKNHYEDSGRALPTCVEDLSMNDYVMLLRFRGTWERFKSAFGGNSNLVYTKLKRIPELRNIVFHFRREITVEEYELLRGVRDWLLVRIRKVVGRKKVAENE
ncbi:MAG: CBS domain-containing protein [Deltaproteobacteria bacterium]|nr:CBS domain-containing protein [Deltaproteobacteria bacterium]